MKAALVLVDLQRDYLESPGLEPGAAELVARCVRLLEAARNRGWEILHVWTTVTREPDLRLAHWRREGRWRCEAGTPGHAAAPGLEPRPGEGVIHKTGFNAFRSGAFEAHLEARGIGALVLAGLHLHTCVRAVAMECLERDLPVAVADEAVGSDDPIQAAAVRRWLSARTVRFDSGLRLLAGFPAGLAGVLRHQSPRHSGETLFEVPLMDGAGIREAVGRAQEAGGAWRRRPLVERLAPLVRLAELLGAEEETLARAMAGDLGKPRAHGLEEVRRAAASLRDVAARAARAPLRVSEEAGELRRIPWGVVGIITPWNNPVAIPFGKIAPALAYGNTVVWKPSPAAQRISGRLEPLLRAAGLPEGVVRMVSGDHTTAQALAEDTGVDAVTLTGSLAAGRALQEISARRLVPLQAELSGNNAAVVWEDADLEQAAVAVAWGALAFAGQRCTANRRVVVSRRAEKQFLEHLERAAGRLVWGDPLEGEVDLGPVIDVAKRDEHRRRVRSAEADGVVSGVIRPWAGRVEEPWVGAGAYAEPVILGCTAAGHPIVQEETMSPLLVVQVAGDFEEALALANGVRHGLAAAVFTRSKDLQERFVAQAQAGIVKVNSSTAGVDVRLPFGGCKASSLGPPEHGEGDLQFYTRWQAVYGGQPS